VWSRVGERTPNLRSPNVRCHPARVKSLQRRCCAEAPLGAGRGPPALDRRRPASSCASAPRRASVRWHARRPGRRPRPRTLLNVQSRDAPPRAACASPRVGGPRPGRVVLRAASRSHGSGKVRRGSGGAGGGYLVVDELPWWRHPPRPDPRRHAHAQAAVQGARRERATVRAPAPRGGAIRRCAPCRRAPVVARAGTGRSAQRLTPGVAVPVRDGVARAGCHADRPAEPPGAAGTRPAAGEDGDREP